MKFSTALTLFLGFALAPSSVLGSDVVERRAKHSSSTSGSLKGSSAKNRAGGSSSSGKGPSKPDESVKVVYVPYPYIPTASGLGNIEYVSEDENEPSTSVQTPTSMPSKHPSEAIKIVYVPVFTEGRSSSDSSDEKEAIAYINTAVPTKMPTKMPSKFPTEMPSAKPSVTPSAKPSASPTFEPSGLPSSAPTTAPSPTPSEERWCNMEYERGCRDSCFKERGCGMNESCKKKCRKQCCSWD